MSAISSQACEVVVFEHKDLRGARVHIRGAETDFRRHNFNDAMSSFVVVSGVWRFYEHINNAGWATREFGPGAYWWVEQQGIPNDQVSSARCVRDH